MKHARTSGLKKGDILVFFTAVIPQLLRGVCLPGVDSFYLTAATGKLWDSAITSDCAHKKATQFTTWFQVTKNLIQHNVYPVS